MSHKVQAFVGARSILELIQRQFACSRVVDLDQGLALLPLTDDFYDAVPGDLTAPSEKGFVLLTPKIFALFQETSTYGVIGYFETRYFSDKGDQGAVFAQLGDITFGPQTGPGSINQMLHLLGARGKGERDEFDSVGLGWFRDNQSWVEKPNAHASTETMTMTGKVISWIHGLGKK